MITGPISVLGLITTPSSKSFSSYLSIVSLGSLYSGIPYLNTPPIFSWASKIVILYPFLAKINANVIPAGPPPIIATLCLFFGRFSKWILSRYSFDISSSISQNLTGSLLIPLIQLPLHWSSWGHTTEQIADNGLFSKSISPASLIFPSLNKEITCGIGVSIGQFALHLGFLHKKHLSASNNNSFINFSPLS